MSTELSASGIFSALAFNNNSLTALPREHQNDKARRLRLRPRPFAGTHILCKCRDRWLPVQEIRWRSWQPSNPVTSRAVVRHCFLDAVPAFVMNSVAVKPGHRHSLLIRSSAGENNRRCIPRSLCAVGHINPSSPGTIFTIAGIFGLAKDANKGRLPFGFDPLLNAQFNIFSNRGRNVFAMVDHQRPGRPTPLLILDDCQNCLLVFLRKRIELPSRLI